jgi:hypothetical protein
MDYAKIEADQDDLRAEVYDTLRHAITDQDPSTIGRRVVLPATFTGSPLYMWGKTQDALCYVQQFGAPDFFITFTCNPKWSEIQEHLKPSQKISRSTRYCGKSIQSEI